jgi:hypothetical protein
LPATVFDIEHLDRGASIVGHICAEVTEINQKTIDWKLKNGSEATDFN